MTLEKYLSQPGLNKKQRHNISALFTQLNYGGHIGQHYYEVSPYMVRGHVRHRKTRLRLVKKAVG